MSLRWFISVFVIAMIGVAWLFVDRKSNKVPSDASVETNNALIEVFSPLEGEAIESPLIVRGQARGTWFFEATFPVVLTNWDGLIIAEGYATAQDEWMTEDFVPFLATLTFDVPGVYNRGTLILQKSNPSGLSNNDDAFELPILFTP